MTTPPVYSNLFACLYDEPGPLGQLGRGTHYSVFRTVEWLDVIRNPLPLPEVHDFAVVWDEDHDTRVIEVIERIYMAGLLSPVQFIGERKGLLTVIVAARFRFAHHEGSFEDYVRQLNGLSAAPAHGDSWPTEVGFFDRSPNFSPMEPHQTEVGGLINDASHRVVTYLRHIDSLWSLGTKPYASRQVA